MDGSQDYYDASSLDSIYSYAKKLEGKTLRTACHLAAIDDPHRRKGSFGNAIEEYYFHYDINSSADPDFAQVETELKPRRFAVKRRRALRQGALGHQHDQLYERGGRDLGDKLGPKEAQ